MKILSLLGFLLALFINPAFAGKVDNKSYADFLEKFVSQDENGINSFAYNEVTNQDLESLRNYISSLENIDPESLSDKERFAFYANLYNAKTLDIVISHYPVESIRDIDLGGGIFANGPWKKEVVVVNGEPLSLDNIEHDILRPEYKDPRVHYAVNCASIGCPNLRIKPWEENKLNKELDQAARDYINHPRGVLIEDNKLIISKIYKWFSEDFGDNDQEIINHLKLYAKPNLKKQLEDFSKIDGYGYAWSLNDTK